MNGDGLLTASDALQVINAYWAQVGSELLDNADEVWDEDFL